MNATRHSALVALVAFAILVPATVATSQAAAGDHWRHLPPLTTACFADDDFNDRLRAAAEAINAEAEKQSQINAAAKEKLDNTDGMVIAQKMQEYMMKNPQAAMKLMQTDATGRAGAAAAEEADANAKRLTSELERLKVTFTAALEQAAKPVRGRLAAHIEAKTVLVGEAQAPMFTSAADHAQYLQLIAEVDAAMEKACVPFFGANGAFHKWLASWRAEVIEKNITTGEGADAMMLQMEALGVAGNGYRSTNPLTQVSNHLGKVGEVYGLRPSRTVPQISLRK